MKNWGLFGIVFVLFVSCVIQEGEGSEKMSGPEDRMRLNFDEANILAELPLRCVDQEYPNKLNQVIGDDNDLQSPEELHPAFFGCFDWHSSVHGHWSIVRLLSIFPNIDHADSLKALLQSHITEKNIKKELQYFEDEINKGYERMYGWAWLLKLDDELAAWNDPVAQDLHLNLRPLTHWVEQEIIEFLPKLAYPIRVGTHTNTAFALSFIHDHAIKAGNDDLLKIVNQKALEFYSTDVDAPLSWEPSGFDFLSPVLEEANLMRRVLNEKEFEDWLKKFLPELIDPAFELEPGIVTDRKDGHLVHLDGLNFSRAWCLHGIAETLTDYDHLTKIANDHIRHSLAGITDGNYEGSHWLASFALLALSHKRI
ncbi:MAG: DUF2891 domain-containing protein [Deltaproteobacteria bacterium]|nr:MAG: DUF2891 domain-containing protein [Deltaproteobacteria bacterium]